jgi:hypothetical protein
VQDIPAVSQSYDQWMTSWDEEMFSFHGNYYITGVGKTHTHLGMLGQKEEPMDKVSQ